jgi:hypothetical protein
MKIPRFESFGIGTGSGRTVPQFPISFYSTDGALATNHQPPVYGNVNNDRQAVPGMIPGIPGTVNK